MARDLSLSQILYDLRQVQLPNVEAMYRHIYEQAWRVLSENGRILLKAMPLASQVGVVMANLMAITGLSEDQLRPAVTELSERCLLEVGGTTWERRYQIHRLTETFLCSEVVRWVDDSLP